MPNKSRNESNYQVIARKVKLYPVGDKEEVDRVYSWLRSGIEAQNRAMNQYMSALYMSYILDATKSDRKELNHLYRRISTSAKGSAYAQDLVFPKGLPLTASFGQKVMQDFSKAMKSGLKYGRISLPTYRDTNPLLVHVDYVRLRETNPHTDNGLYHNYQTHEAFLSHLYQKDLELYIKFCNGILFKLILGNPHKSAELRNVFQRIFEAVYEIGSSSIQLDGNQIILNLSIKIPTQKNELDEHITVGVDLGIQIPAMCALNTNSYIRKRFGSAEDFIRERQKIQAQRRRVQQGLAYTNGGHGREKKLQALDRFHEYEKNWVRTYNHTISRHVVDFALQNRAKYINMEDLSGFTDSDRKNKLLRNWSYYQLQQYIIYKANMAGITVRKVDPSYTSQKCHVCGNLEEGQRISQSVFVCQNPHCSNYGKPINADFNAARNIANTLEYTSCFEPKNN